MGILQRLGLAPEEKQEAYIPKVPEIETNFAQFHKQEIIEDFEETKKQEEEFMRRLEKKRKDR